MHGLSDPTIQTIHRVLGTFPQVERAILFGSRAKGSDRKGSDIDLTFVGEAIDRKLLTQIENALDDALLPYTFSLSAFAMLRDRDFLDHIERVGVTFYERNEEAA